VSLSAAVVTTRTPSAEAAARAAGSQEDFQARHFGEGFRRRARRASGDSESSGSSMWIKRGRCLLSSRFSAACRTSAAARSTTDEEHDGRDREPRPSAASEARSYAGSPSRGDRSYSFS
jgi:hypothetical protein